MVNFKQNVTHVYKQFVNKMLGRQKMLGSETYHRAQFKIDTSAGTCVCLHNHHV